jgi:hypothetical protein
VSLLGTVSCVKSGNGVNLFEAADQPEFQDVQWGSVDGAHSVCVLRNTGREAIVFQALPQVRP